MMYQTLSSVLGLGLEPKELSFLQIALRGIIVFVALLAMVRSGHRRFLSRLSAFDAVLGFILASLLARAVNGSAPFFPTLGCGFVLVGLHRLLGTIAFHSDRLGGLFKGQPDLLVQDGRPNLKAMRRHSISEKDVMEEARLNGQVNDLAQIQRATIERNGHISVIPAGNKGA
jgi:uncharacterized membrane protein YcaP (DUF421 family)